MLDTSEFILPYEPAYTGHREAEKRHEETKRWLRERENMIDAPSLVPDDQNRAEKERT